MEIRTSLLMRGIRYLRVTVSLLRSGIRNGDFLAYSRGFQCDIVRIIQECQWLIRDWDKWLSGIYRARGFRYTVEKNWL
jgi:hypothetical protein